VKRNKERHGGLDKVHEDAYYNDGNSVNTGRSPARDSTISDISTNISLIGGGIDEVSGSNYSGSHSAKKRRSKRRTSDFIRP